MRSTCATFRGSSSPFTPADRRFDPKTLSFADYWLPMQQQLELLSLLKCIETLAEHSMRQFFQIVFSSKIIAKSGGVSLARDLAHTRPHRVMDKNPNSAFVEFEKRLKNVCTKNM